MLSNSDSSYIGSLGHGLLKVLLCSGDVLSRDPDRLGIMEQNLEGTRQAAIPGSQEAAELNRWHNEAVR